MLCNWQEMTGELSYEEKMLVEHICEAGLKETRALLEEDSNGGTRTGRAQTKGAIQAFETIQNAGFTMIDDFLGVRCELEIKCEQIRRDDIDDRILEYWNLRGQQIQYEFVLDRILAYRVMTQRMESSISARAGIYVDEWMT